MKTIDVNNNISAPKPARNLNFPYVNTTFIEADWEAPADQSDCIDYYQVCMTVSGGTACVNQTLDNPTTSYPELRPCTLHTVDVTAWTEGARSSVISAQVNTHNEVANHECVEWYEVCWKGEQIESCNNSTDIQDFITGLTPCGEFQDLITGLTPCGEYSANVTAVGAAGSSVTSHLVVHTRNIGQETGEKGCTTQTRAITKATITGLISCVNYTVNVTAGGVLKNSNAVSTPVMTNSTLMQDKPAIQNLSLSRDSEGNITVTWHPLVEGMMCVRSYNVCWEKQSQPEDNQCLELPSSENHLTISGLHSGATYTVEVSAVLVTGETSEIIREDIPISGIALKKDFQPKLLRGDHGGGLTSFPGRFKLAATLSHTDNNDKASGKPSVCCPGDTRISGRGTSHRFVKYSDFTGSIHQLVICLSDTYKMKCLSVGEHIHVTAGSEPIEMRCCSSTPDRDSNLDLPVTGSLVYCESSALDHVATKVEKMLIHFAAVLYLVGAVSSQTNCSVSSQTNCSGKSLVVYLVGAVSSQTICSGKSLVVYLVGTVSSQTNCSGKSLVLYLVGAVSSQTNCSAVESVSQLKVVSTSGSMVSIQWRAPSDTDCLEEYQVCWSLADGTQSNCTAQSRHEHTTTNITGLSPCTSYVINVTSVGSSGDSSEAVGTTATSAPDKVSQLKVTSTSVSTISIQWRPPSNADCLVGYQVCCSLADGTQSNCTTQTRHEHAATNITGLTPCTNFVVNVTTIGSSGNSSEAVDINVSSGGVEPPPNSPGYGLDDAGIIVNAILLRFQQDSSSVLGHTEHQGLLLEACAVILRKTSWIHQSSSLGARELFDRPRRSVESHKRPKIPLE
uniref:Fibronectin type-III domain-containing protein n=1 Tax=Timema cristinae TaxID=61476 RepID=A0A7R9DBW7_TIMCR|nr:unnamed protein product [Timema cristinae]